MEIQVNNFRGIKKAMFTMANIVLIGAKNAKGKSSLAQAVGGLLTCNPVPVRGVVKSTAGQLVHAGTAAGRAMLKGAEGHTDIQWPKGTCTTEGAPPSATSFAAGLSCVLALEPKVRAKALAEYLDADPTREDLEAGLTGLGLSADQVDKLWEMILAGGWDGAHEQVKAKGAKLKGQWEQITGKNYGKKIAESYVPDGWEPNLDGESAESLQAAVTDARELLEAAIANDAVDEDRRAELSAVAATIPDLQFKENDGSLKVTETSQRVGEARQAVLALPPSKHQDPSKCPHCDKPIEVIGGEIVKAKTLTAAEIAKREKDHDEAAKKLATAQEANNAASLELSEIKNQLMAAQKAAADLDAMPKATTKAGADIDAARGVLNAAEERLTAWQKKTTADQRANSIAINAQIVDALKPAGVRQSKLAKAMAQANDELKQTTALTKAWGVVEIDGELEASLNGTPYALLSKSERYRVRVAVQVWMAMKDKSAAVVIDAADVLVDSDLRNDLFKMLASLPIPAMVTMAWAERSGMPHLESAGLGQSLWIEDGELQPL